MWRALFLKMMQRMFRDGALEIRFHDGQLSRFGQPDRTPIRVQFHDPGLPRKILFNPDLGVGEAYMDGRLTIENDDLDGFMNLAVRNIGRNSGRRTSRQLGFQRVLSQWKMLTRNLHQRNILGRAQSNVAHHYDLSEALYALFLDEDRQYSCAYFQSDTDSLEEAQLAKKRHIAKKLAIAPGMRVLDIGCGWGGMGLTLAQEFGAEVVGVTLSVEQHKIAVARAKEMGLSDRVDFRLQDYRLLEGNFDRIVSVGMFEHVGVPHYLEYFSKIREMLSDDGVALVHTIGRAAPPSVGSDWIEKYIFPGGYIPSMSETISAIEKADLICSDVEVWRRHYAETLLAWRKRFEANIDAVHAIYDANFSRMWRYYLIASEMTFRHDRQTVHQFQLTKRLETLPITRDYIYCDR